MTEARSASIGGDGPITGGELIPDVLRRRPEVREVLDRYGLRGCGGPLGPAETVAYFARAHSVPLAPLLEEMDAARSSPGTGEAEAEAEAAHPEDSIYRRFFLAGIAATLTAGATWGAILLLRLAGARSFGALTVGEVNAHGHAQIFGWVGLFVMGFAYQAFPRFKHTSLPHPRIALASFPVYLAGLVLRTVGEPLASHPGFLAAALAGSVLEVLAIGAFAWIIARALLGDRSRREASDGYLLLAAAWFAIQAVCDAGLLWLTSTAPSAEVLISRVATFQAPLRDIQLHGFALLMILGVSQRFLPGMLGMGRVGQRASLLALGALTLGLLAEVGGFLGLRLERSPAWGLLLWTGAAAIAIAAGLLTLRMRVFSPCGEKDRSIKFIRAAYAWLGISLAMLLLFPLYLRLTGTPFSHAYFGATRHAITVGFVSLMILGVASKVAPTLNGIPGAALPSLWAPFLLVNAGCTMRVAFQTLTDFTPAAFPFAGASGVLEVTGLTLWGIHIARVVLGGYRKAALLPARPSSASPDHLVGWITAAAPETIEVFASHGFEPIRSPFLRSTVARAITIRQACRLKGVDEARLLVDLDRALNSPFGLKSTPYGVES